MQRSFLTFLAVVTVLVICIPSFSATDPAIADATKRLPDTIGNFNAQGPISSRPGIAEEKRFATEGDSVAPEDDDVVWYANRKYVSINGPGFHVFIRNYATESAAYAALTQQRALSQSIKYGVVGTATILGPKDIMFCKGNDLVQIYPLAEQSSVGDEMWSFARDVAKGLDAADTDMPVLVRHLPDFQRVQAEAFYAVGLGHLKEIVHNQPILDEISFDGGAEAVVARYDDALLVIIEFTTPQLAGDNDRRITAKISELRSPTQPVGTPVPSAYRRVGNYSVFVFNAADEKTAIQLIDQVKYEQVVQWLGENPYWFEKAQRMYAQTTAGVLVAVMQSSGLSLLICLGIGGIFGVFLFRRRRKQQATTTYSDAGGMTRLNIDQLTGDHRDQKLLVSDKS